MKTQTKVIIFFVGTILLSALWNIAYADEKHTPRGASVNVNSQALSIATSQIHPELGSSKVQLGFGIGTHNSDTAFAIGLHKRVSKVLVGGTFSSGSGQTAIGAGINLKF